MKGVTIRPAREADVPAIRSIYNEAVLNTTATFDTEPLSLENRYAWFRNRTADFPIVVAELAGTVIGFAALNRWSDRPAYDICAEMSTYVDPGHRGAGVGRALKACLLERASSTNLYTIILRITSDNEASLHLARSTGFSEVGVLRRCGIKFGRLLDVVLLQKILK